ncbi:FadR/GntR family transcriptional regulator [Arthrobacter russicus]|uniref:GntR family transcriptional repressor for pyruvate dehydrogenase complex n=1 Tax=Arthrobacter russicus TaxID=172040 RepID=A0ABU1JBV3_9MICC|nr:FadR/GntR family transcriptional regulator [Arthrobacter russicus]MBQ1445012.1 FadR family transcriptional regulator [Renibacterium sp.]MDN5667898.1 FadR family transcriptional regulator [Renibacterium salmoninarum]MDR6269902.1 GntR family transcriptional repressor for pyruvate dehydrogenase complex [Arthrobacter russicus]
MALTDEAMNKIKDMILAGELSAGDRLPPEKELSEKLGLSRSSLREAVKALEIVRVLDVRRGDGTYVTSLEPQLLNEAISFVVDLHRDSTVLEIFAVRRMLEPAAAGLAAGNMTAEGIAELRANIASVTAGETSVEDLVEHDLKFHQLVNRASGNNYLMSLLESMSSSTIRARIWRGLTQEGAAARTLSEHASIADALERGDAELAKALVTAHISGVETWLRKAIEEPQA